MRIQLLTNEPIVKTFPIGSFKQSTRRVWLENVRRSRRCWTQDLLRALSV